MGCPIASEILNIKGPNLGKSWRDQKLVANQDNKKYIASTAWAASHPQRGGRLSELESMFPGAKLT